MRNKALASAALLALGGCALILDGTSKEMSFDSRPPGALVTVGGQTGVTPVKLDLPKEECDVVFEKEGYERKTLHLNTRTSNWFYVDFGVSAVAVGVDLLTGAWRTFEVEELTPTLLPLPDSVEGRPVTLSSEPSEAEILINGALRGKTPLKLDLNWTPLEKEKDVTFRRAGYHDRTVVLAREAEALKAELDPVPVRVRVAIRSVPPGAEAFLAGASVGRTPAFVELDWLPVTRPRPLELTLDGYVRAKRLVGREDSDLTVNLEEEVQNRALGLKVQPPGSLLEVDGGPAFQVGVQVALAWSPSRKEHVLRFSHLGYVPKTVKLSRSEAEKDLEVRLTPSLPADR